MSNKLSMPELIEENNYLKEQLKVVDYELGRRGITDRNIRRLEKMITGLMLHSNDADLRARPSLKLGKRIWKEIKNGTN